MTEEFAPGDYSLTTQSSQVPPVRVVIGQSSTSKSTAETDKKNRTAPLREKPTRQLYKLLAHCPICLREQGVDAGVVLCVSTECEPIPHLVCYDCTQDMQKSAAGGYECPICRHPNTRFKPLGTLVDTAVDTAAASILDKAVKNARATAEIEHARKEAAAKLERERLQHALQPVTKRRRKQTTAATSGTGAQKSSPGLATITSSTQGGSGLPIHMTQHISIVSPQLPTNPSAPPFGGMSPSAFVFSRWLNGLEHGQQQQQQIGSTTSTSGQKSK